MGDAISQSEKRQRRRDAQKRYAATPNGQAKMRESQRRYRESEHGRAMRAQKQRRHRENGSYLGWRIKKYGIAPSRYFELFNAQGGVCAICREPPATKFALCVDHCHATGAVRGLLCKVCNLAVGNLRDRADLATAAALYLARRTP
jgi:hypothetical protein